MSLVIGSINSHFFTQKESNDVKTQSQGESPSIIFEESFGVLAGLAFTHGNIRGGITSGIAYVALVTFVVLMHELGHAAAIKTFSGKKVSIHLTGLGGYVKLPENHYFHSYQRAIIYASGPLVNLFLYLISASANSYFGGQGQLIKFTLQESIDLNWVMFLFNSLPFIPLDGGHFIVNFCEMVDREKGRKIAYLGSAIMTFFSLFYTNSYLRKLALSCSLFLAYALYQEEKLDKENLEEAIKAIDKGNLVAAEQYLVKVIKNQKSNILALEASYYLSTIYYKQRAFVKAFHTLNFYENQLSEKQQLLLLEIKNQIADSKA